MEDEVSHKNMAEKMSLQTDLDSRAQKESIEDKVATKEINANLLGGE